MADIAIPGVAVMYRALLLCVSRPSTGLSKDVVGVEPLFCLHFWDRGRACARGGACLWRGNSSGHCWCQWHLQFPR